MKNKVLILIILILIFNLTQIQAISPTTDEGSTNYLGTVKFGQPVYTIQTCSTCTFSFISSITYPNGTIIVSNIMMNKTNSEYRYTLNGTFTRARGTLSQGNPYTVNGVGDINGVNQTFLFYFGATATGQELTSSESTIYIILTFAVLLFFIVGLYFSLIIPYANEVNNKGTVVKVTRLKYVKIFCIAITYLLFVWFLNVLIAVSDSFVALTLFYGYISFLFSILTRVSFAFIMFLFVLMLIEIVKDANAYNKMKELFGGRI